jgi:hypothetical protein
MQLRSEISSETLPDLTPVSSKTERDKARPILGRLEAFAACINSCAYDFDTFYKISGSWFHWRYQKMQSYIEDPEKKQKQPHRWEELAKLAQRVNTERARTSKQQTLHNLLRTASTRGFFHTGPRSQGDLRIFVLTIFLHPEANAPLDYVIVEPVQQRRWWQTPQCPCAPTSISEVH